MLKEKKELSSYSINAYNKLIQKGHFLYKVNQKIDFDFVSEECKDCYSLNFGRPTDYTPEQVFRGAIVQYYFDISDRKLEQEISLNIQAKWFIGLEIDDTSFDHSLISKFRVKLGYERFDKLFDQILDKIIKAGCLTENERLLADTTAVIANVAIPKSVELIKQSCRKVYAELVRIEPKVKDEVDTELLFGRIPNMKFLREKKEYLTRIVKEAFKLIELAEAKVKEHKELDEKLKQLSEIVNKHTKQDKQGMYDIKRSKDCIVSLVDKDARISHKSNKKIFFGYKAHMLMSQNGFITKIEGTRGNITDNMLVVDMVNNQLPYIPYNKLVGDKFIGSEENRHSLLMQGKLLVSPFRKKRERMENYFTNDMFYYDKENNHVVCPAGETSVSSYHFKNKHYTQHSFAMKCKDCPLKQRCTPDRRRINISDYFEELKEAKSYNETEDYKEDMKIRKLIEPKIAEMTRFHGMRRTRYRGLERVGIHLKMIGIVVNLKRLVKLKEKQLNVAS